jgi:CBS domain-containing protein
LRALLDLDQAPVREVMTPRVDVVAFDLRGGLAAFEKLHLETFRKIPVHEGSVDRIVGMLVVSEVLSNPDRPLGSLVRKVPFVPESATVADVLESLRESRSRLAVVVDEYGGTEGIVALEDVIEGARRRPRRRRSSRAGSPSSRTPTARGSWELPRCRFTPLDASSGCRPRAASPRSADSSRRGSDASLGPAMKSPRATWSFAWST